MAPARFNISWTSDDGKAGIVGGVYFNLNSKGDGFEVGPGDDSKIWLKPIDQIKITLGGMDENNTGLRGDLAYGSWNWLRPFNWLYGGEGLTFSDGGLRGIEVQFFPIEGLQIFAALPLDTSLSRADLAFGQGRVGAGYTIDGIGTAKLQFVGQYENNDAVKATYKDKDGKEVTAMFTSIEDVAKAMTTGTWVAAVSASTGRKYGTFEAGFDLTGIDKLYVTLGVAFTVADETYWKANAGQFFKAALGASYGITESFKISADFQLKMYNSDSDLNANKTGKQNDPAMAFGVGFDFGLTDALALTADVRMLLPNNDVDPTLSFLVGANYSVNSNASLGIGFQGAFGLGGDAGKGSFPVVTAASAGSLAWAIPIRVQVSF